MTDLFHDLRYALRMLVRNPVFTAAAVLTLALGIGLNAATYSAVSGILLRPLGGTREPERLVQLYREWGGLAYGSNSIPHYQDLRDRGGDLFENVAAWGWTAMSLSADGRSERVLGMMVSANFFQTYGASPELGRAFLPGEEDRGPDAHPVIVLGHGFWETRFGADPSVIGRTVTLNGHPFEVVGVAPTGFRGPVNYAAPPIFAPLMMQRELAPGFDWLESRGNNMLSVVARLRPGVTVERARQGLDAMLSQLRTEYPDDYTRQLGTTVVPQMDAGIHPLFRSAQVGMSAVMMAVVGLLLLIACVNVANLFLARAHARRREMGVRLSLGAGRGRVLRQLLTESLVFSLLAGLAGLGLAQVAVSFLANVRPPMDGPWAFAVELDRGVLWFTFAVSVAAGLLFGLAPALQAASPDTVSALKGETAAGRGRSRVSSALVVLQMALSILLLISSGLFLRSLQGATEIDPGFKDPGSLVLASVDPGLQGYEEARSREFLDRLTERVAGLPGVAAVGLTDVLPLGLNSHDRGVEVPGYEFAEGELRSIPYALATEGYLEALGTRLLEGRTFTRLDDAAGPPVIIVNRRFADRFWPGASALGRTVRVAGADRQVIGVVATGKYQSLGEDPTEFMILPQRELFRTGMTVVARTTSATGPVLRGIQRTVRELDPELPVFDARTMEDHMGIALMPARLGGTVLGLFGLLGLLLAAIGIYGVMAYSVAQRGREMGIRVAMGADRASVVKLVVGEGFKLALAGVALGLLAAAGAAQLVESLLYNVNALDPVVFVAVPGVLLAVAALAVFIPARRAAGVDPMRALKAE